MRHSLIILLVVANLSAQVRTNLTPLVQVDLFTPNSAAALLLSNTLVTAVATNVPKIGRTTPVTVSPEPGGGWRLHATYEFNDLVAATNLFQQLRTPDARLTGRILIYCQPDERTTLTDWGGADADRRAKITEIKW